MGYLITVTAVAMILFFAPPYIIRGFAQIPFRWTITPAQRVCLVVTHKNLKADDEKGGNVVDILHGVPGKILVRKSSDPLKWYLKAGDDPDHDNYLYKRLGVQDMGSIFYNLRINSDERERYARDWTTPQGELKTLTKKQELHHVFFSGEMQITVNQADTSDRVGIDLKINFVFERKYPARSILRLADAPAFLVSQVENIVNNETSTHPVLDYYGGPNAKKGRLRLANIIDKNKDFKKLVEDELGLAITTVAIRDVDLLQKDKDLLEKKVQAEKEMEAATLRVKAEAKNLVTKTEGEKKAQILRNDADADRVERVVKPAAENDRTVAVRVAEAYENNKFVTTYAPGKDTMIPLGK